jgi:hypothetical protein
VAALERIDRKLALRAGLVQLVAVGVVFAVLAISLPHSFFKDWGIVAGPTAWIACAAVTARVNRLPYARTIGAAALAGVLGALAGLAIGHDAGIVVAIGLFALAVGTTLRAHASPGAAHAEAAASRSRG